MHAAGLHMLMTGGGGGMKTVDVTRSRHFLSELMNIVEASPRYLEDEQIDRMGYCQNASLTAYGLLAYKCAQDSLSMFPMRPKLHVPWTAKHMIKLILGPACAAPRQFKNSCFSPAQKAAGQHCIRHVRYQYGACDSLWAC